MGATGTGKSAIIRQLLVQIRSRGDQAIIYDPGGTYLSLFYDPAAGDIVLNPLDARCPYWTPGDELRPGAEHAESLTMAHALFPAQQGTNPFFTDQPRRLMAYLLTKRPSPKQLIEWLTDADFLQDLLKKTGFAHTLSLDAPEQRSGVLASLNVVTDSLKVLPEEDDCRGRWSAAAWAPKRRGFIFLTSTPQTRARLIPLQSLWLDTLILRLMDGGPERPPTWFVLDEVASLNRLPQLHTAVTENRKHNNPIVIGCQGRSQLESRYGQDAETMIAQPATKILLRTSEPAAAEWASKAIGEIEIERLTESRRDAWGISWDQSHLSLHRQIERLVMASEMEGLDDLTGYVKLGNTVAPLQIRYLDLATRAQDFVPRVAPAPPVRLQPLPTDVPCVVQSLT
jgi:type IV secretory pathway TraG/TraD family ATPase VirD4